MTEKKAKDQKQTKEEDFDIKEIYTPLSVAKKEIWRRWNDKELKKKVEDFLGGDLPDFLGEEPKAVLVRYVITPDIEYSYFMELVKETGLEPIAYEYSDDKLVASNSDKYHLCKLFVYNGEGKNGGSKIFTRRIIDFNKMEGKKINETTTLWGSNLVDFHHDLLEKCGGKKIKMSDFSGWFNKNKGKKGNDYYLKYFALFICHGILFENYLINEEENGFTSEKVIPGFMKLANQFGVRPLIVPLAPREDETYLYWWCYPEKVKKFL